MMQGTQPTENATPVGVHGLTRCKWTPCDNTFTTKAGKEFCSDACRHSYHTARRNGQPNPINYGREFTLTMIGAKVRATEVNGQMRYRLTADLTPEQFALLATANRKGKRIEANCRMVDDE